MISLVEADVSKVFNQVNTRKATGLDDFPRHILSACAEELATIFLVIFNLSLSQSVIPKSQAEHHHSSQELSHADHTPRVVCMSVAKQMYTYMLFNHCTHTARTRLHSQALKLNLVLFVTLDTLQVLPLPSPHSFLGANTHVGD